MAQFALKPALARAEPANTSAELDSSARGHIPSSFSYEAITPASFDTGGTAQNRFRVDDAGGGVSAPNAQSSFTQGARSSGDSETGFPSDAMSVDKNADISDTHPSIAAGDGGAPEAIHIDMHPSRKLWDWLATAAGADQYVIDSPPNFITRFRRAVPEFVRREKAVFAISKRTEPPREHALLVYQSVNDPHVYTTRVVAAKDAHGIVFRDFVTGNKLPFGRLPELSGFRLIIAEHTHPLPWYRPFRRTFAAQGPSNLDVAVSKLNPNVYFVINAVHTNDFIDGSNDESYYYGRDVQRR
jgi:hypothetical protein